MFNRYDDIDSFIDSGIKASGISKKAIEETKVKYSFQTTGLIENEKRFVCCDPDKTLPKYQEIKSPFTLLTSYDIKHFKLLSSYYKNNFKSNSYEEIIFKVLKFIEPVAGFIIVFGLIFLCIVFIFHRFSFAEWSISEYIILLVTLVISTIRIFLHSKEKNLQNKLLILKLGFEIFCRHWIGDLYYSFVSGEKNDHGIKAEILKEMDSFIHLSQLSGISRDYVFNLHLRLLCEKVGIDFEKLMSEKLDNLSFT